MFLICNIYFKLCILFSYVFVSKIKQHCGKTIIRLEVYLFTQTFKLIQFINLSLLDFYSIIRAKIVLIKKKYNRYNMILIDSST